MPAAIKLLSAPAAAVRSLMVLQAQSLMLARQLVDYLLAAAAALACLLRWRRCTQPSMVLLYTNCRGGYHSDLRRTWHSLQRTVEAGEPGLGCAAAATGCACARVFVLGGPVRAYLGCSFCLLLCTCFINRPCHLVWRGRPAAGAPCRGSRCSLMTRCAWGK